MTGHFVEKLLDEVRVESGKDDLPDSSFNIRATSFVDVFFEQLKLLNDKKPFGLFLMGAVDVEFETDIDGFAEFVKHRILE
jgi:hypothetical protein